MHAKLLLGAAAFALAALGLSKRAVAATPSGGGGTRGGTTPSGGGATRSTVYIVKAGDNPWNVALQYTGEGRRYTELRAVNPAKQWDSKTQNFTKFYTGERINLPASWLS